MVGLANVCELAEINNFWMKGGRETSHTLGKEKISLVVTLVLQLQFSCLWRVYALIYSKNNVFYDVMWCSPGKYLRGCCSQSHWRCCIQTDWEERASPAGGRGRLGASYWGPQEAVQTDRQCNEVTTHRQPYLLQNETTHIHHNLLSLWRNRLQN